MTAASGPFASHCGPTISRDLMFAAFGLTAGLLSLILFHHTILVTGLTVAALSILAIAIAVEDYRTRIISDGANFAFAAVALCSRLTALDLDVLTLREIALYLGLDLALSAGVLWAFREIYYRLKGYDGLGLGDVKLAVGGGLLLGGVGFASALFTASLLCLVVVGCRCGWDKLRGLSPSLSDPRLPFGTFLAPVSVAIYVANTLWFGGV